MSTCKLVTSCFLMSARLSREPGAGTNPSGLADEAEAGAGRGARPRLPPRRVRLQALPPAPHLLQHPHRRWKVRAIACTTGRCSFFSNQSTELPLPKVKVVATYHAACSVSSARFFYHSAIQWFPAFGY
jgi:hypothetical protein